MTKIIVVNEKDEIIGYKDRDDRNETDIIRVSALILLNSKNQTLIARRALNKILDSGKWGPAAAGTLEEGESYLSNIIKEAQEEIGFKASKKDLSFGRKKFVETSHKYFLQIFITETNLPLQNFRIYRKEFSCLFFDRGRHFKSNSKDGLNLIILRRYAYSKSHRTIWIYAE